METQDTTIIRFRCRDPKGLTPDAQNWLARLEKEVRMTMPAENVIRIEYPTDIVENIRTVNVDDMIYRLDFIAPGNRFWNCNCVFPDVPWNNREFMIKRWKHGVRAKTEGVLTITYPEKECKK